MAHRTQDRSARLAVKRELARPAVKFTGLQARAIGRGFADYVASSPLRVWACSILPEHVHLVVGRAQIAIEQIVIPLKARATRKMLQEKLHPFASENGRPPHCWSRGLWSVFLDSPADIIRCIRYVEENPVKDGKPRQHWPFVSRYDPNV